jgi:uncharacterized membrane protein YbhN (UPF0104 family)
MNPPKSPRWVLLINVTLFAIAFGLLGLVVYQNKSKIAEVFAKPVDFRFFAVGMAVYLVALLITFFRWHQLVRAQGMVFSYGDAVRLGFIGNIWNLVIPGGIGGDVIKAGFLCRMQPDRKSQAIASMVLDRILGLLGLFLLAGIAGAITWRSADSQVRVLIGIVWGVLAAGMIGLTVIFSPWLYRPIDRLVAGRGKIKAIVCELEEIGLAYRQAIGRVVALLVLSTCVHGLFVLAFYLTSVAIFETMPTLLQHYLMVPLALFTTAVPLPFGALGLSEGLSGRLFNMVDQHEGAIAMMAFRIQMYGGWVVSAIIYLTNLRQVREIVNEAPLMVGVALEETIIDPKVAADGAAR